MPDKRSARSTSKQITHEYDARSVTQARERVRPWLELANLLPPPPSREEQSRYPLASFVLHARWLRQTQEIRQSEFMRRFERSGLLQTPAFAASIDWPFLCTDPDGPSRLLHLAQEIADTLAPLAMALEPGVREDAGDASILIKRLYIVPPAWRTELWIDKRAPTIRWIDPYRDFMQAIEGLGAIRLGQCPVCNRFFFGLRKDQKACSTRCNAVRRVRDWRAKQDHYEYQRKLRGAGLALRKKKPRNPPT